MKTKMNNKKNRQTKTRKRTYLTKYTVETIVLTFLEMLNTVKLYHWKTHSYAQHKASDELYSELNSNIDSFVETMLGKTGNRANLINVKSLPLDDYNNVTSFKNKVLQYRSFLINMTKDANLNITNNSDLLNIRDEILGNVNQFLYLITFH
jgi:DNA-binding ferritin-like protein